VTRVLDCIRDQWTINEHANYRKLYSYRTIEKYLEWRDWNKRKWEHMSPILRDLHWLPVTTADRLQDSSSGVQVSTRHGPRIPPGVLPANVNCRLPTSPVCWLRSTGCSPHQDELRRMQFRRPGTAFVEQSSCWTTKIGHVQTQTEDVFI